MRHCDASAPIRTIVRTIVAVAIVRAQCDGAALNSAFGLSPRPPDVHVDSVDAHNDTAVYFETFLGLVIAQNQQWQHNVLVTLPTENTSKLPTVAPTNATVLPSASPTSESPTASPVTAMPTTAAPTATPSHPGDTWLPTAFPTIVAVTLRPTAAPTAATTFSPSPFPSPTPSTATPTTATPLARRRVASVGEAVGAGRRRAVDAAQRRVPLPVFWARREMRLSEYTADRYGKKIATSQNIPFKFLVAFASLGVILISVGVAMICGAKIYRAKAQRSREERATVRTAMTTLHALHMFRKPRAGPKGDTEMEPTCGNRSERKGRPKQRQVPPDAMVMRDAVGEDSQPMMASRHGDTDESLSEGSDATDDERLSVTVSQSDAIKRAHRQKQRAESNLGFA